MARIKFEVVKAPKVEKVGVATAQKSERLVRSKYYVMGKTLKQLNSGDYIIALKDVDTINVRTSEYNLKARLRRYIKEHGNRNYTIGHMPTEGKEGKYNLIVKRD